MTEDLYWNMEEVNLRIAPTAIAQGSCLGSKNYGVKDGITR